MRGIFASAIVNQVDEPGSESDYVSVADTERFRFARHPWSIGGGGAAELKDRLDENPQRLKQVIRLIGYTGQTNVDEVMLAEDARAFERRGVEPSAHRPLAIGEFLRDWSFGALPESLFPYGASGLVDIGDLPGFHRWVWPIRTVMGNRATFAKLTYFEEGRPWWEWHQVALDRLRTPLSIAFAFVATHNHFVLDRGGKLFNRSAPMIKLTEEASVDQHLALVGLLDSSIACFWMKQAMTCKGNGGIKGGIKGNVWDRGWEFEGTKLQQFPLPAGDPPTGLARLLDSLAMDLSANQPSVVCAAATPTRARLDAARAEWIRIRAEMVGVQEELDWMCLHLYGLTEEPLTVPPGETVPPLDLGERAFEIVMARQMSKGEIETAWFTRHRSTPITELPAHWPNWYRDLVLRRINLIDRDRDVALVERPDHKRRWAAEPWEKLEDEALREWLVVRLEDRRLWVEGTGDAERAVCRSLAQLADRVVALNPDFLPVARLWKGVVEIDPVTVIAELVASEHVPAQSATRYKESGWAKRRQWERTWDLQRIEDRGEPLPGGLDRIPVPPTYAPGDFAKSSYSTLRGKLDVPKERFVSVTGAERDADSTLVLAWAGFDHAQQAQAIGTLLVERQQHDGWDSDRLWPLVVALAELLPWLEQWHAEVDPRWGASPARLYSDIAEQYALAGGRTLTDTAQWQPAAPTRGRRRAGVTQLQMTNEDEQ